MARNYNCVSGDSHLEVLTERWTHRVPARYRDQAPKNVRLPDGADGTTAGGRTVQNPMDLYGGKGRDVWQPFGQRYGDTPGTGSPEQRLKEQKMDGIDAEVLFPAVVAGPPLWKSIADPAAQKAVFRAYNDWLAEEYCSVAPDRLFGVGALPLTGLDDAVEEMAHCAKLGLKAVNLTGFPNGGGRPAPEDDRFWATAVEMDYPVTIHVDIDRSGDRGGQLLEYPVNHEDALKSTELAFQVSRFARSGGINAVQLILSGLFDRFPTLKIDLVENCIGWVPFFMEMADVRYKRHIHWSERLLGYKPLKQLPSEYIREHFYWGFQVDRSGVELRHWLKVDHLIWAVDFPHQESEWPNSKQVLEYNFAGVPDDERRKMTVDNAVRFFKLDQ